MRTGVLAVLAVLITVGALGLLVLQRMTEPIRMRLVEESALRAELEAMREGLGEYYEETGCYAPSLEALVSKGFLAEIPVDPVTQRSDTWKLSYEDENRPKETVERCPEPGITAIRSGSFLKGTDGRFYRDW